jgi:hypothetical protein
MVYDLTEIDTCSTAPTLVRLEYATKRHLAQIGEEVYVR